MAELSKLTLIYDLDQTLCTKKKPNETYNDVKPIKPIIDQLNKFYDLGYNIIIETARNMVTQGNDEGKVIQNVGEITLRWLREHGVKYHAIKFGKSYGHIYIDDKACLDDPAEIERRIQAWHNGTEKEYLANQKQVMKRIAELEEENRQLKIKLQAEIDSSNGKWDNFR
jgi:capsule biosynthesis phosphatase